MDQELRYAQTALCSSPSCPCCSARPPHTRLASMQLSSGGRGRTSRYQVTRRRPLHDRVRMPAFTDRTELLRRRPGGPDCGVFRSPTSSGEFTDNIDVTVGIGEHLGVGAFNALYGNRVDESRPPNRTSSGGQARHGRKGGAAIGATVLLEPVSGPKPYPLRTAADVVSSLDGVQARRSRATSASCSTSSTSPTTATTSRPRSRIRRPSGPRADRRSPGRHEPGSGTSTSGYLRRSRMAGYDG